MIDRMLLKVQRFLVEILDISIPDKPQCLHKERKEWALLALQEEINEFKDAKTIEDEADALLDLTYYSLGRLVEMGLVPGAIFDEVHNANMRKVKGPVIKRLNIAKDAKKPPGWYPPNLMPYIQFNKIDLQHIKKQHPKLLIMGHARHGKDTVAGILKNKYGFNFISSSLACAHHIIWPIIWCPDMQSDFLRSKYIIDNNYQLIVMQEITLLRSLYFNITQCYENRRYHRAFWFKAITWYNKSSNVSLAKSIFRTYDIYCGLRNIEEFEQIKKDRLVDFVLWIDASKIKPEEDITSCTVHKDLADFIIDNNSDLDQLGKNIDTLMAEIL